jgi:serine-type D-Ala-D-Ala carboxypeptidase/endopeptidase (penicillin-binding protein 4)
MNACRLRMNAGIRVAALVLALVLAAPAFPAGLAESISRLLASSETARSAFWGIEIVDLGTGKTLYELNPHRLFVPASNAKLFTAALALSRLGPDYVFHTRVLADAAPDASGTIRGAVRLAGGGDPNLSGRVIPYRMGSSGGDPLAAIEELADQVAARGVRRIEGDLAGDDTWYVFEPYAGGWEVEDPQFEYGTAVSALAVNDNTLTVAIRPGAREGDLAALSLRPGIEFYDFDNRVRTAAGGERKIQMHRDPGSFQVRVWGSIPLRDRGEDLSLGIEDPALYAAQTFRRALENRGIAVTGRTVAVHLFPDEVPNLAGPASAPEAPGGFELARRDSAPLLEDLRVTAKVSQNLHAEMALRAVGRARRGIGSREAGLEDLEAFLGEIGIDPQAYSIHDGSGLSRPNLVTPAAVVKLLRHMYGGPERAHWLSLLPVAGQDGTLSGRFVQGAAAGRIHAKTGTLEHIAALSGYAELPGGDWAAFSIMANNYNGHAADMRGVVDRVCALLIER